MKDKGVDFTYSRPFDKYIIQMVWSIEIIEILWRYYLLIGVSN